MTGSIRELPPGKRDKTKRWEIRAYAGRDPVTGRPRQVSRTVRGGKREATNALAALVVDTKSGTTIGTKATVGRLLDDWLADLERQGKTRGTLTSYRGHVENHIRPALGGIRLDKMGPHVVSKYLSTLSAKGLKAGTIRLNHAILSAALAQGVSWEWLKANPAKGAKLPRMEKNRGVDLTREDLGRLCKAAYASNDQDEAVAIALAAITGCRLGEITGLQWADLDTERCALEIQRHWVAPGTAGPHYLADSTKNHTNRTVNIGAGGVALLEGYRAVQAERQGREPEGWLLSYNGGVTPLANKALSTYFSALAKRLGIKATFRTLRSWKQTELNRLGVDLATAAAQGGHTVEVMARSYLTTNEEQGAAAGELIAGVVVGAIGTPHPARQVGVKDPHQPADPSGP